MPEISVFWLRAAAALYAIGLFHTVQIAFKKGTSIFRPALFAFAAGVLLHTVSLVESARAESTFIPAGFHNSVSLCAYLFALVFLAAYARYRLQTLGTVMFPLVFAMSFVAAITTPLHTWTNKAARDTWLVTHIALVLLGYAALLLTALASGLYLVQERRLKQKKRIALLDKLPPLGVIDSLISISLGFGFVLLTIGVVTGATWAVIDKGTQTGLHDPRLTTALVTWVFCLIMLWMRITVGWRGRKAALLAVAVVACSAATWAVHYVSH